MTTFRPSATRWGWWLRSRTRRAAAARGTACGITTLDVRGLSLRLDQLHDFVALFAANHATLAKAVLWDCTRVAPVTRHFTPNH